MPFCPKSPSTRRKSPTSAWEHSTFLIRKPPEYRGSANNLPGAAEAVEAAVFLEAAVAEAAVAEAAAAEAAALEVAAVEVAAVEVAAGNSECFDLIVYESQVLLAFLIFLRPQRSAAKISSAGEAPSGRVSRDGCLIARVVEAKKRRTFPDHQGTKLTDDKPHPVPHATNGGTTMVRKIIIALAAISFAGTMAAPTT